MAVLRKRYYSVSKDAWIDLNTNQTLVNNSRDIKTSDTIPEKIRLIGFDTDFSSSTLMDLISDLVYNDVQALEEAGKIGAILSDGVFKGVGNSFNWEVLNLADGPNSTKYMTKFLVRDGLINKSNNTAEKKTNIIIKKFKTTINSRVIESPTNQDITELKIGMLIRHPSFTLGTQIDSIDLVTKKVIVSQNALNSAISTDLVFTDEGVFSVRNIENVQITSGNPAVFGLANHGFVTGEQVVLSTTGTLPSPLVTERVYYVVYTNANTFGLATSYTNALDEVRISTTGTASATVRIAKNTFGFDPIVSIAGTPPGTPLYRRDLIEFGVDGNYNILRGIESIIPPPIHTVLDSFYNIDTITWNPSINNQNIYRVRVSTRIARNFVNEFSVGKDITLLKTADGKLDNVSYTIIAIGTNSDQYIDILVPGIQGINYNQTYQKGFIDSGYLGLYSVELYRDNANEQTLIDKQIDRIYNSVGILSGVNEIYRARLIKDEFGVYSIQTKERVHLTDAVGRWLDYKSGQSTDVLPSVGFAHSTNVLGNDDYDNTQLPQEFDAIDISSLANIPFVFNDIQDNIFNQQSFVLDSFIVGIKNDVPTIGDEGIEAQIVVPQLALNSDVELSPIAVTPVGNNFTITFAAINLPASGIAIGDILFVTTGSGQYQNGRITQVTTNSVVVTGFTKAPSQLNSKFIIFKNSFSVLANSTTTISNAQLKSQVISGVNGRFGNFSSYSKVKLTFGDSPTVNKSTWYFIRIKGRNEGVTWGNLPYIVTENPYGTNTTSRNALVEVNYRILNGTYGIDNFFHLEDSFGDLKNDYSARLVEPHFRPRKYTMVAKPLEDDSPRPVSPEMVYIDVTGGKILFHPEGEPIEVFAYYHKLNVLSGDSTDFSVLHRNALMTKEVTLQDKINELSSIFHDGASFDRPITVNGILNKTINGFRGPIDVRQDDAYRLVYKEEEFTNHTNNRNDYKVRANISQDFGIIKLEKSAVVIDKPLTFSTNAFNDTMIPSTTLDDVPSPALDEENRLILIKDEAVSKSALQIKTWNKAPSAGLFEPDTVLIDSGTVKNHDGSWNDFHNFPYDTKNVLKFIIRKKFFENLSYPGTIENRRHWKSREVLKNVTDLLNDYSGSTSQIVSEKYITIQKNDIEGVQQDGEYFVIPYRETTKYSKFAINPTLKAGQTNLATYDYSSGSKTVGLNISNIITYNSSKYYYTLITDPNSTPVTDRPRLKRQLINKSAGELDYNELTALQNITDSIIEIGTNGTSKLLTGQIVDYSEELFVLVLGYQDDDDIYKIDIIWYSKDLVLTEQKRITIDDTIDSQIYASADVVSDYTLVVAYKKDNKSVFRIVNYDPFVEIGINLTTSDSFVFTTNNLLEAPVIQRFSRNSFLILYTDAVTASIKKYDVYGNAEFFDVANTLDQLNLTTTATTPSEGAGIHSVELADNSIFILWHEKITVGGVEQRDSYIANIDEWYKLLVNTESPFNKKILNKTKIARVPATTRFVDWDLKRLNDDIVLISKRSSDYLASREITITGYQINCVENPNRYTETITQNWKNFQITPFSDNGFIWSYSNFTTFKVLSNVFEYRPDFANPIIDLPKTNASITVPAVTPTIEVNYPIGNNKNFVIVHSSTQATRSTRAYLVDNSYIKEFRFLKTGVNEYVDIVGINDGTPKDYHIFTIKNATKKLLVLVFRTSGIPAATKFKIFDITNNTLANFTAVPDSETLTQINDINTGISAIWTVQISDTRGLLLYVDTTGILKIVPMKGETAFETNPQAGNFFGPATTTSITCNPNIFGATAISENIVLFTRLDGSTTKLVKITIDVAWGEIETAPFLDSGNITVYEADVYNFASSSIRDNIKSYSFEEVSGLYNINAISTSATPTYYYNVSWENLEQVAYPASSGDALIYREAGANTSNTSLTFFDSLNRSTVRILKVPDLTPTEVNGGLAWIPKTAKRITKAEYDALVADTTKKRNIIGTPDTAAIFSNIIKVTSSGWEFFESFSASNSTTNFLAESGYSISTSQLEDTNYTNALSCSIAKTDGTGIQHQVVELEKNSTEFKLTTPIISRILKESTPNFIELNTVITTPLTQTSFYFLDGTKVELDWDSTLSISGLTNGNEYYVANSQGQKFQLSAAATITPSTVTFNLTSNVVTWTAGNHGFSSGKQIRFQTAGTLPTGIYAGTAYYVEVIDTTTFYIHETYAQATAGSPSATRIDLTGSQSGTHTGIIVNGVTPLTFTIPTSTKILCRPTEFPMVITSNGFSFDNRSFLALTDAQKFSGTITNSVTPYTESYLKISSTTNQTGGWATINFNFSELPYSTAFSSISTTTLNIKPYWNFSLGSKLSSIEATETYPVYNKIYSYSGIEPIRTTQFSILNTGNIKKGSILVLPGSKVYYVTGVTGSSVNVVYYGTEGITAGSTEFDNNFYTDEIQVARGSTTLKFKIPIDNFSSNIKYGDASQTRTFIKYTIGTTSYVARISARDTIENNTRYEFTVVFTGVTVFSGNENEVLMIRFLFDSSVAKLYTHTAGSIAFSKNILNVNTSLIKEIDLYEPNNNFIRIKDIKKIPDSTVSVQVTSGIESSIGEQTVGWVPNSTGYTASILASKNITTTTMTTPISMKTSFFSGEAIFAAYITSSGVEMKELIVLGLNTDIKTDRVYSVESLDTGLIKETTYYSSCVKLGGNNYRGGAINVFPLYKLSNQNIINSDGLSISPIDSVPVNVFKKNSNTFSVVYQPLDSTANNAFLLRDYIIINNRFFVDSDFYKTELFSFPTQELYSKNLQAIALEKDLFYSWKEQEGSGDEIKVALVDHANNMINATSKNVRFIETVYVQSIDTETNEMFVTELGPIAENKKIRYGTVEALVEGIVPTTGGWTITVDDVSGFPTTSFAIDLALDYNKQFRQFELLGIGKLVEDFVTLLIYDKNTDIYYTPIFDKTLTQVGNAPWFSITAFDRRVLKVSNPTIDSFANFYYYYKDSNNAIKYFVHGIDGDRFGVIQMVGKI